MRITIPELSIGSLRCATRTCPLGKLAAQRKVSSFYFDSLTQLQPSKCGKKRFMLD